MKKRKHSIIYWLCCICYIVCLIVIISESCMGGELSSSQSNTVGGAIAEIINNVKGDQTIVKKPTSIKIDNKISTANVNDTYQLHAFVLPEDATYKSIVYSSSNENVATINENGLIHFIKEGSVTFFVYNDTYVNILDEMSVYVSNVIETSISCSITNATIIDDVYHLDLNGSDYYINTTLSPSNVTNKNVTYHLDNANYISIDENGKITPKKYSADEMSIITISSNYLTCEIKVVVDVDIIELETIDVMQDNYTIYPTQIITPKVTFTPKDATFKEYRLKSSDESIVRISSFSFKGVKQGIATVKIISLKYESIVKEIQVQVLPSPSLEDFTPSLPLEIVEGTRQKISIKNISPAYASLSSIIYQSLDPSIATVDSTGVISAISIGQTSIILSDRNNIFSDKTIVVNVIEKSVSNDYTIDFDITYKKGENPGVIINNEVDITDYFSVDTFYYEQDHETTNKEIKYSIDGSSTANATLINNILKVSTIGEVIVNITHVASKITKIAKMMAIDDFDIDISGTNNSSSCYINKKFDISINNVMHSNQSYFIVLQNNQIATISSDENNKNVYHVVPLAIGEIIIDIIPCYGDRMFNDLSRQIIINSIHRKMTKIDFSIYDMKTNETIVCENNELIVYKNDKIMLKPIIDKNVTIHNIVFSSSNEDIATINMQGILQIKNIGVINATVMDNESNLSKSILIKIYNKIEVDTKNAISFSGKKANYDSESQTYSLINGYSGKIKLNFTEDTTYTSIKYMSDDEKIITVGKDGTLTPKKAGKTTIHLICDDGVLNPIVIDINVEVLKQNFISDLSTFFLKVRKAVGHFGAFLVLGIFSTITYLLLFNRKKTLFAIFLNYLLGFTVGCLSEYIQIFVPGRYGVWKDVVIDFLGFMISATVITIIIVSMILLKERKKKKNDIKSQEL